MENYLRPSAGIMQKCSFKGVIILAWREWKRQHSAACTLNKVTCQMRICIYLFIVFNTEADDMYCTTMQPQHLLGFATFRKSQHAVLP